MAFGKYRPICGNEIGEIRMAEHVAQLRENKIHTTLHLKILNGRNNPW